MKPIDQAIEILRLTRDGNDLAPSHLAIVQAAVNDGLNEQGEIALTQLHRDVRDGTYRKLEQYLFGIEHLTRDHQGYVYWRGQRVEHYSHKDIDRMRAEALELAARCRRLEVKGFPVNGRTVSCPVFEDAPAGTPWLEAMRRYYAFFIKDATIRAIFHRYDETAVAIEVRDDVVQGQIYQGAYEAYQAALDDGYQCIRAPVSYSQVVRLFMAARLTPQAIHDALC